MSDVTHAKCPACGSLQPVLWNKVKQIGLDNSGYPAYEFNGVEAVCRRCDFSIATLGTCITPARAAHNEVR